MYDTFRTGKIFFEKSRLNVMNGRGGQEIFGQLLFMEAMCRRTWKVR